jgi:hypothetical protein
MHAGYKGRGRACKNIKGEHMAETLGSLVDKLAIKSIREFYIEKGLRSKSAGSSLQAKKRFEILIKQKKALLKEIDFFIKQSAKSGIVPRDEKLKMYNKPSLVGNIGSISSLSTAIDKLVKKNLTLWQLEDEARREDVSLAYIGGIKRKIDSANQQRNDLIDKIDEILEKKIKV